MANKISPPKIARELPSSVIKQMLTLASSGFGLVAALAWNEFVKEAINQYIKPILPQGSVVISLFIYAVLITSLAVIVTLQLSRLQEFFETKEAIEEDNKFK